jgi:hypothetical protein
MMTQITSHSTDTAFSLTSKIFSSWSQRRKQRKEARDYVALDARTLSDIGFAPGSITWIGRPPSN